jgi:hypothetical protein
VETTFIPAQSKLDAVQRISRLTGSGPEELGPGSKERKSVLVNLGRGLGLQTDEDLSKPKLGEQIAGQLGAVWDQDCHSEGYTITLVGLNRLLEAAEHHLASRGRVTRTHVALGGPGDEAVAILTCLANSLPRHLDGRECVSEMRQAEFAKWAGDEWVGWYFEFRGLPELIGDLGGGPEKIHRTTFDYVLSHVWDLKAHSEGRGDAPLNDQDSMREAVEGGRGLGLIVLSGEPEFDDGEFKQWQREERLDAGKRRKERRRTDDKPPQKRRGKAAFRPTSIDAYFFADVSAFEDAIQVGALRPFKQGVQQSGEPRNPKYSLVMRRADEFHLATAKLLAEGRAEVRTVRTPTVSVSQNPTHRDGLGLAVWAAQDGQVAVWHVRASSQRYRVPGDRISGAWLLDEADPRLPGLFQSRIPLAADSGARAPAFLVGQPLRTCADLAVDIRDQAARKSSSLGPPTTINSAVGGVVGEALMAARWAASLVSVWVDSTTLGDDVQAEPLPQGWLD